nr:hypothetical protein [Hyphomonas sp.]
MVEGKDSVRRPVVCKDISMTGFKITTIAGARPHFVKAAAMSRAFAADGRFTERLVHTGQHYDFEKDMHTPVGVTHPRLADLVDLSFENGLRGAARFAAIDGWIELLRGDNQDESGASIRMRRGDR